MRLPCLLREICRRTLGIGVSFTNRASLYRSIVAIAREMRMTAYAVPFAIERSHEVPWVARSEAVACEADIVAYPPARVPYAD